MSSSSTTVVMKKRERTQNWIPEEKTALFSLIKIHAGAIENKKIDATASTVKTLAWQEVYRSFRGRFSTERDITRMREQWRRMKAQARIEIYTFAEKVRTLGAKEAAKSRPSNLSIEVWRLMESSRRRNEDAEASDESSLQDAATRGENFEEVLEELVTAFTPEVLVREVKIENDGNERQEKSKETTEGDKDETGRRGLFNRKKNDDEIEENSRNFNYHNEKRAKVDEVLLRYLEHAESEGSSDSVAQLRRETHPHKAAQNTLWIFEAAQKEHDIKLKMLNIELERAELQKQTALNELKTSEMKIQLIENQTRESHSQVRMSGEPGSGAGKGGGGGGAIRQAGGSFGKMEAAREDQYFYNQQKDQLNQLRESLHDEISFHEEQIKRHQEAIDRHKNRIGTMEKK